MDQEKSKEQRVTTKMTISFKGFWARVQVALIVLIKNELTIPIDVADFYEKTMGKENLESFKKLMLEVEELKGGKKTN